MSSLSDATDSPTAEQEEWRNRSTAELKEIAAAGVAGGDRFVFAVREIERRSEESFNRANSLESERNRLQARKDRNLRIGLAIAALGMVVVAIIFL